MKKRFLIIPALALLFGGAIACSSPRISEVRAEAVEVVPTEETYTYEEDGASGTLVLKEENIFELTINDHGEINTVTGTYEREGNIVDLHFMGETLSVEVFPETGLFGDYFVETEPVVEEPSRLEELYEEALEKINELKENQFIQNLISTISGGLASMLVSCLFMFVNRDTMRKCLTTLKLGERTLSDGTIKVREAMDNNNVVNEKIEKAVSCMEEVDKHALAVIDKADKIMACQEEADKKHDADIQLFLTVINGSKELVANGTAEKLNQIYGKK